MRERFGPKIEEMRIEKDEKEKNFLKNLENQGFLGKEIKEDYLEIKNTYKQQLLKIGKKPNENETWDELIRKEIDKHYAEYIKEKVNKNDKKLINDFLESDEENLLPFKKRQEFLNVLLRNNYSLYANKEGKMVSMSDYLKEYYKDTGTEPKIEFKTIDPDVKRNLAIQLLKNESLRKGTDEDRAFTESFHAVESNDERIRYILDDEIAIPHLVVKTENNKIETPLIAGGFDIHIPLRSEKQDKFGHRKRRGHSVQFQIIHAPKYVINIQKIIAYNIHEIDHAIRETLPTKSQKFLDKDLLIEGTAEKASIEFMNTQHKHFKNDPLIKNFDGYDYQANLQQVVGKYAIGNEATISKKKYRYAQGYMIAEGYNKSKGEENYKKLFYTGELDVNEELGDVEKIREGIDEKLKSQKEMFRQILSGDLDKE